MKVEVNLKKKQLFLVLGIIIIIATSFIVYGYQSGGPPELFGHSAEEVQLVFQGENTTLDEALSNVDSRLGFLEDNLFLVEEFMNPRDEFNLTIIPSEVNHPGIGQTTPVQLQFEQRAQIVTLGFLDSRDEFDVTFIIRSSSSTGFAGHSGITVGLFDPASGNKHYSSGSGYNAYPKIAFESIDNGQTNPNKKWLAVTALSNTPASKTIAVTSKDLGTTPKWTKLRIVRLDSETIGFYINDEEVATSTVNIPSTPMKVGIIAHDLTNTQQVQIDFFRFVISNLNRRDLSCSTTAFVSTTVSDKSGFRQIAVPNECIQGTGCILKREVFDSANRIKETKVVSYKQEASNLWTGSYQGRNTLVNGDTKSSYLMSNYGSNIQIRDDRKSGVYIEESSSFWSLYDATASYGQRLFLCTYN